MLIGIPPVLGPDLLATLRAMGHGDELAIVDGNYPALDQARRLIRADGHGLITILDAVLLLLPLDHLVPCPILRTGWANDPMQTAPIHDQIDAVAADRAKGSGIQPLAGDAFYARVRNCHAVVATSESALYANVILRKGVIAPAAPPVTRRPELQ